MYRVICDNGHSGPRAYSSTVPLPRVTGYGAIYDNHTTQNVTPVPETPIYQRGVERVERRINQLTWAMDLLLSAYRASDDEEYRARVWAMFERGAAEYMRLARIVIDEVLRLEGAGRD